VSPISDSERQLEEFLSSLSTHQRKGLECCFQDMTEKEATLYLDLPAEQYAAQTQRYMQLLGGVPERARQHRRRARKMVEILVTSHVRRGRPQKDAEAEEMAALENSGLSHSETADYLNDKYAAEINTGKMAKRTSDNVRKLLSLHYEHPNR
jgi:hypothetical protein